MTAWLLWPLRLLAFVGWYARELVLTSYYVLRDNLTPGQHSWPGNARVVTHCLTDAQFTLLVGLITLTPGTLVLGTRREEGRRVLYVHGLYFKDADAVRADVAKLERRLLKALPPIGAK